MTTTLSLPRVLEPCFTERLVRQQQASPHTLARDRDPCCLLWRLVQQRLHQAPSALTLADLDAPGVGACLAYLEHARGTSARSRHVRLAAMHALFHAAALHAPSHRGVIPRVLALPSQRDARTPMALLTGAESDALVAAPDQPTCAGRRDRTLRLVAVQTGLRVSEWIGLCWQDVVPGPGGARAWSWQRSHGAVHPPASRRDPRVTRVAARTAGAPSSAGVSHRARWTAEPGWRGVSPGQPRRHRSAALPLLPRHADLAACLAPQRRDGPAAQRR